MKKAIVTFLVTIATFYITGCKKLYDQVHKDPAQEFKYCDITKFKIWFEGSYNEFTVTYNNKKQPKDVVGINPSHNPSFDQHFRYDKKGRLTDWISNYPGDTEVYIWETFYYISPTQVLDSSFAPYGLHVSYISDPHHPYGFNGPTRSRIFDLDAYGRIIKITPTDNSYVINFTYNADGNLTTYQSYDNGVGVMRTNEIWMFINNDYSINNNIDNRYGTNVFTYNSYMLPTSIQLSNGQGQQYMTTFVFDKMEIEYDCKGNPKFY